MPDYTYLSKYFREGDKILLYARGKNGKGIYQFLKTQPQYTVVGFVDRNADKLTNIEVPVYMPGQLKHIPPETYDKIVITVIHQEAGQEVYHIIQESGVAKSKIVAPYTYIGPETDLSFDRFIESPLAVQEEIKTFISGQFGNLLYFKPLIQALKMKGTEKAALLERFRETVHQLTPLENVVFLHILYLSETFNGEFMKYMLENLLKIDDADLRQLLYAVSNDLTTLSFLNSSYLFPEFYTMRRSLLKKICKMYSFSVDKVRIKHPKNQGIQRICVVFYALFDNHNKSSAPILLCVQFVNMLVDLGYEVKVITLDPHSYLNETPVFRPVLHLSYDTSADYLEEYKRYFHPKVSIESTDSYNLKERLQSQLNRIISYSPDLIFDMSDEYSILSYIYSQYFPTLYIPMRGYQSSSFFTYYIAKDKQIFLRENKLYNSIAEDRVIECADMCILSPKPRKEYTKKDFSMESNFVLVTVGSRLNVELKHEFCDLICERLLSKLNVKWLIVGSKNEYLLQIHKDYVSEGKIIYVPYEDDLPALYNICDVYLNPERMGGGASIYWAMCQGVPVAVLSAPSDILPVVGIENTVGNTYEEMIEYVLKLWSDTNFYQNERNKFQQRAEYLSKCQAKAVQDIISAIKTI